MRRVLLFGLLVLLAAATSSATKIPTSSTEPLELNAEGGPIEFDTSAPVEPRSEPSGSMMDEIKARIAAEKEFADGMTERALVASGMERLAIQKQIHDSAAEMALDILRIQARYARLDGRDELAQKIEATIEMRIEARNNPSSGIQTTQAQKVERKPSFDRDAAVAGQPVHGTGQAGIGHQGGER